MQPVTFVIFGATGDLAQRKLVPALHALFQAKELPQDFALIGFGRKELSQGEFRQKFAVSPAFSECISYVQGAYDAPDGFKRIAELAGKRSIVFYLSTPPETYGNIVTQLKNAGLSDEKNGWRRVIIEKPFGSDTATARQLNDTLRKAFREEQIFRIDHYLAKETVRQIPVIRAAHAPKWGAKNIDHVQITISEDLGIGERGGYYDQAGALRDMVQSHALQVLALLAMELPGAGGAHDVRAEKIRLLRSIALPESLAKNIVRAQYAGYAKEAGVRPESTTETFIALQLAVKNERWNGVPFYIRSGKRMKARFAEAHVVFKDGSAVTVAINPRPGVKTASREAHEVLFPAVIAGDAALFPSWDEIELCWGIIDRIIAHWNAENPQLHAYAGGTAGPSAADELLGKEKRKWIQPS